LTLDSTQAQLGRLSWRDV